MIKCNCTQCKNNDQGKCDRKNITITVFGTCKNYKFDVKKYLEEADRERQTD